MSFNTIIRIALILQSFIYLSQSLICPKGKSQCNEDMTCCKLSSGKYGCCPLPSAQCCLDGLHCCPNGTKCDNKEGSCLQIKELKKRTELKLSPNGLCPDKNHTCQKFETCCKIKSGGYACCPYNLGVCCSDMLHCCPHGTKCDLIHRQCVRPSNQIDDKRGFRVLAKEMRLIGFEAKNVTDIVCPGGQYDCPDGNTCCKVNDSEWGCCPLKDAVCCADQAHCCPNGYKCSQSGCQSL